MRRIDHSLLDNAKVNKRDEFYTQYCDIQSELKHYESQFAGKTVFCNCDNPRKSNFYKYFADNFKSLKLKALICSCYVKNQRDFFNNEGSASGFFYVYDGTNRQYPEKHDLTYFNGDGDFRSSESLELLKQADIVVTNPPFSLFREFVDTMVAYQKQFLVIGNVNAITYKNIFALIKANQVWLGINLGRGISGFIVPDDYPLYGTETRINEHGERIVSSNNCLWLTNLDVPTRHTLIPLVKTYCGNESAYPIFDNYNAINVNKTKDIPKDYMGAMGVPITFLHKFNPKQFEIIKFRKGDDDRDLRINGKSPYFRILIRRCPC